MSSYRTPLGRVRGLGAAKHGVGDFIIQRVSGAALVILLLWGLYAAVAVSRIGFAGAVAWLHAPLNATGVVLAIGVAVLHMHIGMREIILDYVERPLSKAGLLTLNAFLCVAAATAGIVSVLRVAFGGA